MDPSLAAQLKKFLKSGQTARNLSFRKASLEGIDLANFRADNINFEGANFQESKLINTRWVDCILRDAQLNSADFTDAVFRLCNLDQARINDTKLSSAYLEDSTARGAQFDRAILTEAVLTDTDFSRSSFCDANFEGASASGASFRGADLSRAVLRNADLSDTDLRGADLTDADLEGVILDGADLRGAIGIEAPSEKPTAAAMPEELKPLIGTVTPLVEEMLRSAGQGGFLSPEAAQQLQAQMADVQHAYPSQSAHPDTLQAISQVIGSLGDSDIPSLLASLEQPNSDAPPPSVQVLIRRLGQVLELSEDASAEEVLTKLSASLQEK
ncbi:MAG: pentapeptide repeat-containing protein [Cyanobacteria bacterium P01_A01_bin.135]